jgi:alpha-mannosidase
VALSAGVEQFWREVIRPSVHRRRCSLEVAALHVHGEPISAAEALGRHFESFAVGRPWGGRWDTTWFRLRGAIPDDWAGEEVAALVHLGGDTTVGFTAEGQIWDREGRPIQGLHHKHRECLLTTKAQGGEPIELYVEAAANPVQPWKQADWPLLMPDYEGPPLYVLGQAELATIDREVEALYFDLRLLQQLADQAPLRAGQIREALEVAAQGIDRDDVAGGAAAVRAGLAPLLAQASTSGHTITAVGHAHIDSAWLWPVRETKRKCARTFSNQLRLMERYPEHRFACSPRCRRAGGNRSAGCGWRRTRT